MTNKIMEVLDTEKIIELSNEYTNARRELLKCSMKVVNRSIKSNMKDLNEMGLYLIYESHLIERMISVLKIIPLSVIEKNRTV